VDNLIATTYGFGPWSVFSLSSPTWTWEYVFNTGQWHRRKSYLMERWRGTFGALWEGNWYVQATARSQPAGEHTQGHLNKVVFGLHLENGDNLPALVESLPIKEFPANLRIPSVDIDAAVGVGSISGEVPIASLSWSHNGGASWSNPIFRRMGVEGEWSRKLTVRNLGRSTHHGVRLRLSMEQDAPFTLMGGIAPRVSPSRPRGI
jgi:hypothetical protein